MKKNNVNLKLSAKETGLIAQGLTLGNRLLRQTTSGVTLDYNLGPRGAWIVRLIAGGRVIHPLDVTNFFVISRSVISDELARLLEARLIVYRKSRRDGRRVELALTPLGEKVSRRVRKEIGHLINQRFSAYSHNEVARFGRMLEHFVFAKIDEPSSPGGLHRPAIPAKPRRTRARSTS
jgi:DNA-binding MarR family transcriptional regulator